MEAKLTYIFTKKKKKEKLWKVKKKKLWNMDFVIKNVLN